MDRLFDINLTVAAGWTDGTEWSDCNPAQEVENIYRREFSGSEEEDPEYRIDPGDNFYIGSNANQVKDWTPRTLPWTFDIDKGREGNPLSFYFGLQVGEREIDYNLDSHSPWIQNVFAVIVVLINYLAADHFHIRVTGANNHANVTGAGYIEILRAYVT